MTDVVVEEGSSVGIQLARIDERLEAAVGQFDELKSVISNLDGKVDILVTNEAYRAGEHAGIKRSALILAGSVSVLISGIAVAVSAFVN